MTSRLRYQRDIEDRILTPAQNSLKLDQFIDKKLCLSIEKCILLKWFYKGNTRTFNIAA